MPKRQLTANLLDEFMEKMEHLNSYMSAYRLVSGSEEAVHYELARKKLRQAFKELRAIAGCPVYRGRDWGDGELP